MAGSGFRLLAAILLATFYGNAADAACSRHSVKIDSEGLANSDEKDFEAAFRKALEKVCAWWGPDYTGPIAIRIEDSRGPSMALLPAWRDQRGVMIFRTNTAREGRAAITHELVHVFATNANRFLAEGLAVYAHERLGGAVAHPNYGEDLHVAAKAYAEKADLRKLDGTPTPKRLTGGNLDEKENYIVAGSFVRFLIETYGLEKIRRLYAMTPMIPLSRNPGESSRWTDVYGKGIVELDRQWKARIAQ